MEWWHLVIIVLGAYLLLTLGSWLALQIVEWLLQQSSAALADDEPRLQELRQGEQAHALLWPAAPRPGRYEAPDRMAQENLAAVRDILAEADRIVPALDSQQPAKLSLFDALAWRVWGPLITGLHALREVRALRADLGQGDEALGQLGDLQQTVEDIPGRVRALLNEQRAEAIRLSALYETEIERGTKGLDDVDREITTSQSQIEGALDALTQAGGADLPVSVVQADTLIDALTSRFTALDQRLEQVTSERAQAQDALAQVQDTFRLAEDRWAGLQSRGATEPSVARSLGRLREALNHLSILAQQQTLDAYRETRAQISDLQVMVDSLKMDLDHLDDLMGRSKEAMEGNLKALADSHAACDELVRRDILLDPDRSLALVERATQAYMEAERQRGLGTVQGYTASLELAGQGAQIIEDSRKQAEAFPGQVQQVRDLLAALQPQALGAMRSRADRLREQLLLYTRYWERGLNADMAEAISLLDQAEVDLERLAPNVRYQRRFRQSETEEALDILSHTQSALDRSGDLMAKLESERERITNLREQFEEGLMALAKQSIPELQKIGKGMMPDTKQHLDDLIMRVNGQSQAIEDPSRIDYDEAVTTILPALAGEAAQVRLEHERNSVESDDAMRDISKRLDRAWSRLARLQPQDSPGPEEDVELLAADVAVWHAEAERQAGNLPAVRDLVGRRATTLEQRIENAEEQIMEGRRKLESLEKEYRRHAQTARDTRLALREMQQQTRWASLHWDWARAENAWQDAVRLERAAQQAAKLVAAADSMRQALNSAEEAEDLFGRVERQMAGALRRLDDELRGVDKSLERAARQAMAARDRGDQETLTTLETSQAEAQRLVQAAVGSVTFEEALRNLRDARQAIETA